MKKILITIIGLVTFAVVKAQQTAPKSGDPNVEISTNVPDTSAADNSQVFTEVEQAPSFKGGIEKFYQFLNNNVKYPAEAKKIKLTGKVVVVFVVEKDGSITNAKIFRGLGNGCDEEAMRVIKKSPKWSPGMQNGRPVRVQLLINVHFTYVGK